MRRLISSPDRRQVYRLEGVLFLAGIDSEIRSGVVIKGKDKAEIAAELWVRDDDDYHTAAMLYVDFATGQRQVECGNN